MENWPYLLYDAMRSGVAKPISVLYFISWVFLGNFMLLNLFLAILLDSFTNDKVHKIEDDDEEKKQREKHLEELSKKEGAELIEYYSELNNMGDGNKKSTGLNKKKKKKKKKKDENLLDESFEFDKESISKK
jgi:predicted membrane protein